MSYIHFLNISDIVSLHGEVITPEEGDKVQIKCEAPQKKVTVMWLRVVDNGAEFIASYHSTGIRKTETILNEIYSESKMQSENILSIKKFNFYLDILFFIFYYKNIAVIAQG